MMYAQIDYTRHKELMQFCKETRERTRRLIAQSERLRSYFVSPFAEMRVERELGDVSLCRLPLRPELVEPSGNRRG